MATITRRKLIQASPLVLAGSQALLSAGANAAPRRSPACDMDGPLTPDQIEGPYFKPASPQRMTLLDDTIQGERMIVEGTVYDANCKPILGALLDFWQADGNGEYDNTNFGLRGHQYVDGEARFHLETVVPGYYPRRTRHIHVKVQAPGHPILTTQLYFPEDPGNKRDPLFDKGLAMKMSERGGRKVGWYDFVLAVF